MTTSTMGLPFDPIPALQDAFEAHADPERAVAQSRYMRGQFEFYGLGAPVQRRLAREILASQSPPDEAALIAVTRRCWQRPQREWQYVACDLLGKHASRCSPALLDHLRTLITTKSWWDTVDTLAAHSVGRLLTAHPDLQSVMDDWIDDENIWLARTAIIHQLRYKSKTDADRLFRFCARRAGDREFFIRKAIGWALREYSKTDPDAVCAFVDRHADVLSPLSVREATRRLGPQSP